MAQTRKDLRGRVLRTGESQRRSDERYVYTYTDPLGRRKYVYAQDLVTLREKEAQLMKDQMDGLDIYIGDYTQPDPLPAGMLRKMASAHALGFFDHEKKAPATAPGLPGDQAPDAAAAAPISPPASQPRDDVEAQGPADVAQSRVCNAVPGVPSSEPEVAPRPAQDAVVTPASHTHNDHDAHLRLQPDDAPQRQGVGRGTA